MFACNAMADKVSEDAAHSIASKFIAGNSAMRKAQAAGAQLKLATVSKGYYAYNIGTDGGFILVAADDNVENAVLGYSDNGTFDLSKLPDNARMWLSEYDRQVELAAKMPKRKSGFSLVGSDTVAGNDFAPIEPMITSKWNQGAPYNNMCPEIDGIPCLTGCMATALAQIMRYHRWPEHGTGTISYTWTTTGTVLTRDFSENVYNYDAMTDTYDYTSSQESQDAVALLMADAGYAMQTGFGTSASGSTLFGARQGLIDNLGYGNGTSYQNREYYSKDEWNRMIYNELAESRPVYYIGSNKSVGHAFVCDGYLGDGFFHFNWGWSGYADGYFLLTVLDPGEQQGYGGSSEGYALSQQVLIGMQRNATEKVPNVILSDTLHIESKEVLRSGSVTIKGTRASIHSLGFHPTDITIGFKVVDSDSNAVYIPTTTTARLSFDGYAADTVYTVNLASFPDKDGVYGVYPAYRDESTGRWYDMRHLRNTGVYSFVATVKGDSIKFSDTKHEQGIVSATGLALASDDYVIENKKFSSKVKITCPDKGYSGSLLLGLSNGYNISTYNWFFCDQSAGETQTYSVALTAPTAGDYTLHVFQVVNGKFYNVDEGLPVTVVAKPTGNVKVTNYTWTATPYAGDKFNITADVECADGDYCAQINALYADNTNGYILGTLGHAKVNLTNDGKQTVTIECTAPDSAAGYLVAIMDYENRQISSVGSFDVVEKPQGVLTLAKPMVVNGQENGVDPENLQITATVKCAENDFNGKVAVIFCDSTYMVVDYLVSLLDISKGDSATVELAGASQKLKAGATYTAMLYYKSSKSGNWNSLCDENGRDGIAKFTVQPSSGITVSSKAATPKCISIYTSSGVLMDKQYGCEPDLSALPAGLYVIKVDGKTYKTINKLK